MLQALRCSSVETENREKIEMRKVGNWILALYFFPPFG
jgi:hypothetical protein